MEQASTTVARQRAERTMLIAARKRLHLSQQELADRLRVSRQTISNWENGDLPQPLHLRGLCELFGCSAKDLGFFEYDYQEECVEVSYEENGADTLFLSFRQKHLIWRILSMIWNWSQDHHLLQTIVLTELQLEDTPHMTSGELMTRRDVLRCLALLPIDLSGLSAQRTIRSSATEKILAQCAAGIVACWQLRNGKDLTFADYVISAYLPTLKGMVQTAPTVQKRAAADLVAQALLLKCQLAKHLSNTNEALRYIQQAEIYSQTAENSMLQIIILRAQASVHDYASDWKSALQSARKAAYVLLTIKKQQPLPWLLHSAVYAGLGNYQAHSGDKQDALSSFGKAHSAFAQSKSEKESLPVWISHDEGNLLLNDGLAHYYLGLQQEAIDSFAKVQALQTTETWRVEATISQVMAELSRDDKPRDMEWCIKGWIKGIEGAKALQSNPRFEEAIDAYTGMCVAWPGELRIKQLHEHIVHW